MAGRVRVLCGFAAFGAFWGAWGATLPAIQSHAGVDDGQLGLALLCIGAGALASMRGAGTLVDRWGAPALPAVAGGLCRGGGAARDWRRRRRACAPPCSSWAPTSGAVDVAINAEGVRSEAVTGRPVLSLAHGTFSACVVVGSLAAGALRAAGAGAQLVLVLVAAARGHRGRRARARSGRRRPARGRRREDRCARSRAC